MIVFVTQLRKVTDLYYKNGTRAKSLALWFFMVLEQKQKQFWNWHVKWTPNPALSSLSVICCAFCLYLVVSDTNITGAKVECYCNTA